MDPNLVGSKKRKRNSSSCQRSIMIPKFSKPDEGGTLLHSAPSVGGSQTKLPFPTPTDSRIQAEPSSSLSSLSSSAFPLSESDTFSGISEIDFNATYLEVGEDVVIDGDSECVGSNDMSTSDNCIPSTSTSSTSCDSLIPTEVLSFKYPSIDNQGENKNQVNNTSDCENPSRLLARLFNLSNSAPDLRSFSQLAPPQFFHLLFTNTVKTTEYDKSSSADSSESSSHCYEVGVKDYKLNSRTLLIIHPLLLYNKENSCPATPIRCFLPAKKVASKSLTCVISRSPTQLEEVQLQLEIDPTPTSSQLPNFVNTFETEVIEHPSEIPAEIDTVLDIPSEETAVNISQENPVLPLQLSSAADDLEMSSVGPQKLKSSDVICYVTSTQGINSGTGITTSAPAAQVQLIPQTQLVHYSHVSPPTTMSILNMPQQIDYQPGNQIIFSQATHILPSASLNQHPGIQAHSILRSGGNQVLLTPAQQSINLITVSNCNSGVIINQNSTALLQDNPQDTNLSQTKSSPITRMPENKQVTVAIMSDHPPKYVINGPANPSSAGGSVKFHAAGDLTNDMETSRPGFASPCHHCGTLSSNFHCCDSCRRTIPRGSRILSDPQYRKSTSTNLVGASSVCPIATSNNAKKVKVSTTRGGGGVMSKRGSRKKVQQEIVTLSSDEEEECDPSPEKKAKLSPDVPVGNSAVENQSLESQEIPQNSTLQTSDIGEDSLRTSTVVTSSAPISAGLASTATKADNKISDLIRLKDEIRSIVTSGVGTTFVQVQCRSFRVGTHKVVLDSTKDTYFNADVCSKGVMFSMPHVGHSSKKVHLVIPHNAILTVTCHAESAAIQFLLFRIGNKMAKWFRDTLGMTIESKDKAWFDPHQGSPTERNIVFMLQSFNLEHLDKIKNIYGRNLQVLDSDDAHHLLTTIAQPTYTNQLADSNGERIIFAALKTSVLDSNSFSSNLGNKPSTKLEVNIGPTTNSIQSVSSITVVVDKQQNKNQESKIVLSDKPNTSHPTLTAKKTGPISRSQSEKDKVKNGALSVAVKSVSSAQHPEIINDGSRQVLKWPKGQLGIALHQADLLTLRTEQFLNDQILDFWLLYFHNKLLSDADRGRTHVFSTFFYSRLTTKPKRKSCAAWEYDKNLPQAEKRHRRVKKWTKNVDIFSKDYIIVPINDNCHWYVAIICYPGLDGPHWVDDGTPIEGWTNLAVEKGKPKYNLPPGMTKRDDDKPPKKKKKRDSRLLDNFSVVESAISDSAPEPSSTPSTPTKQPNGALPVLGSKDNSKKDDMDGNAPFPGVKPSAAAPPTPGKCVASSSKPPEDKQAVDSPNKNNQSRNTVSAEGPNGKPKSLDSCKPSSSQIGVPHIYDSMYAEIDPYKDEADDDRDEDALFEEYYFSDSDTTSHGSPGPGPALDPVGDGTEESAETVLPSVTTAKNEGGGVDTYGMEELNKAKDEIKVKEEEGPESVTIKVEHVGIKIEPKTEPMDVDVKPQVNSIEEQKNIRTDFRVKQPCILLFNSLSGSPRSRVFATLREYLRLEYRERKGKDRAFTKFEMPGFEPNVPQQKNMCDCGIYVLEYVEHFFSKPFPSLLLALPSSLRNWFPQLVTKRKEIYDTIVDLVKSDCPDNLRLLPTFELPPLPIPAKADKSETMSTPALSQNQIPVRLSGKPESFNSAKIEKICNVSKHPKTPVPLTEAAAPGVKTEKKLVIRKLPANKAENSVNTEPTSGIPKILSKTTKPTVAKKSDSTKKKPEGGKNSGVAKKTEGVKKSEGAKKTDTARKSEGAENSDGVKKIEKSKCGRKSETAKKSETLKIPDETKQSDSTTKPEVTNPSNIQFPDTLYNSTQLSLISEGMQPNLEAVSLAAEAPVLDLPTQSENMDTVPRISLPEEIPMADVVSAPTLKIVPVIPSEEPMDVDV